MLDLARAYVPGATLRKGEGERIPYADASIDLCVATGIMHHVHNPTMVIAEMFRVSRRAVLISDHNNFAMGSLLARRIRMLLWVCGLFEIAVFVKQGFSKQGYTEDDGWWYPYSLFNNHAQITALCAEMFIIPTTPANLKPGGRLSGLIFSQSHFAVLGMKATS
jgi:hypothetical protein